MSLLMSKGDVICRRMEQRVLYKIDTGEIVQQSLSVFRQLLNGNTIIEYASMSNEKLLKIIVVASRVKFPAHYFIIAG